MYHRRLKSSASIIINRSNLKSNYKSTNLLLRSEINLGDKNKRKHFYLDDYETLFPNFITDDDPKPALFIVRKLFSDFVHLAHKKIELILDDEKSVESRHIFESLFKSHDIHYQQILEALGCVSEFCLPSLLKLLIEWYHVQLDNVDSNQKKQQSADLQQKAPQVANDASNINSTTQLSGLDATTAPTTTTTTITTSSLNYLQAQSPDCEAFHNYQQQCHSPCDTLTSNTSITIRSPTPSSPDTTSNQISITSTLPLEYQSPSLTIVSNVVSGDNEKLQAGSSAANTSNSTATNVSSNSMTTPDELMGPNSSRKSTLMRTRKLLIEYAFCQALIEIFEQLYLHPGHEDLIEQIINISFDHFKYIEDSELSATDLANINQLADKYSQVIGVLSKTRYKIVKKRFVEELNNLRAKELTPINTQCIVTLLSGIKYFRVKMAPIEDFEASFKFLQELADYFLEIRNKSIRHALANLFVEILVPLAIIVKNEVKIPCLKNFVDTLWAQTMDMCTRKKHSSTLYPLVTCLLCLGQRSFFLANWGVFLNSCISNLKNRDQKMCRLALESLYRLVWIYVIRVRCESNNVTQVRLLSVVEAIFPKGSRSVTPRDAPSNVFVDIIHLIAQERLDFAMKHILYDLLSVERPFKIIVAPERMNIAIKAFLSIVDSLQQKEAEPEMPKSVFEDTISSKDRQHLNKMLNDDIAKSIGIYPYHTHIQKSFTDILKALDTQYGKPLLEITNQNSNKEPGDLITSDQKPKIDLFITCLNAIPRLMPEGMARADFIDLLSRMTVHVDRGVREKAMQALKILLSEFPDWRLDVIEGYTSFFESQISGNTSIIDLIFGVLLKLNYLMRRWKDAITANFNPDSNDCRSSNCRNDGDDCDDTGSIVSIQTGYETISSRPSKSNGAGGQIAFKKQRHFNELRFVQNELNAIQFDRLRSVLQKVEAVAYLNLFTLQSRIRNLVSSILRETRYIMKSYVELDYIDKLENVRLIEDLGENDDFSISLRGSISADNLSRITTNSAADGQPLHSSATSINTHSILTDSISKMCFTSDNNVSANQNQLHSSNSNQDCNSSDQDQQSNNPDVEEHASDFKKGTENLNMTVWLSIDLLQTDIEDEYKMGLGLLSSVLKSVAKQEVFPFDCKSYLIFTASGSKNFPGLGYLLFRGCTNSRTHETSIDLLNVMTPHMHNPLFVGLDERLRDSGIVYSNHMIILLTRLLADYYDPPRDCLEIANRLVIWIEQHKFDEIMNLQTVLSLYSRKAFSKDAFQWTKCVVKYIYDAYPRSLPSMFPILLDLLENGPRKRRKFIAPILYCILIYIEANEVSFLESTSSTGNDNDEEQQQIKLCNNSIMILYLMRIYLSYLGDKQWRDALQMFKLIISRSSTLSSTKSLGSVSDFGRELPGRTMDFTMDMESIPVIARAFVD